MVTVDWLRFLTGEFSPLRQNFVALAVASPLPRALIARSHPMSRQPPTLARIPAELADKLHTNYPELPIRIREALYMRIVDSTNIGNSTPAQSARPGALQSIDQAGKGAAALRKSSSATDSVQLSSFADRLSQSVQAAAASRAQRIGELTAAVRSGTYHVDASAISHAMVSSAISSASGGKL